MRCFKELISLRNLSCCKLCCTARCGPWSLPSYRTELGASTTGLFGRLGASIQVYCLTIRASVREQKTLKLLKFYEVIVNQKDKGLKMAETKSNHEL